MKQSFGNYCIRGLKYSIPLLFASLLMLLQSCTDEQTDHPTPIGEENVITFSVKVPGGFAPATYALAETDENAINTVDVLLFGSGSGEYISGPHYGAIGDEDETSHEVDVTIRIPEGDVEYDMVILANCRKEVNEVALSGSKEAILSVLTLTMPATGWISDTDDEDYRSVPMWAETAVSVAGSTASVTYPAGKDAIELVRMLARVNVAVDESAPFELTHVYLCNYNDAGNIASTVTIPTPNQTGFVNAILYSDATVVFDNKCINEIYTFEAATADEDDYNLNSPCLVIGGTYNGETYYYRVDFVKKEANDTYTYLNLLRNHKYEVNIENIRGPGYTDPENALESRPINVEYAVEEWDESGMTDVVYDGQYLLDVSQSSFLFDNSARDASSTDNTLIVTTNYSGWDAEISEQSTDPDWLSITKTATSVQLTFGSNSGGASFRTAKIKITAGNLEYIVNVTQTTDEVGLKLRNASDQDITELVFDKTPVVQTLKLSWLPASLPVYFTASGSLSNYKFDGVTVPSLGQVLGGTKDISVTAVATPTKDNPLIDLEATITYLVSNGDAPVSRTLTLKQQVWDFFMSNHEDADLPHQSTLSFESLTNVQPDAQTVTIAFPANSTAVSASTVDGYTITQTALNLGAGTATYTIQPDAKSTAVTNETKSVDFTVTYGGLFATKSLSLSQTAVAPYLNITDPSPVSDYYYLLNGSSTTINFNTNVPWKIKSVTETITNGSPAGSLIRNAANLRNTTGNAGAGQSITVSAASAAATGVVVTIVFSTSDGNETDLASIILPFAALLNGPSNGSSLTWAGSNIYYDPDLPWIDSEGNTQSGRLTFASNDDPDKSTKQFYQGVFFKWGSLYGTSPTGTWSSSSRVVYPPHGGTATGYSWDAIPYVSTTAISEADVSNNYLYYLTDDVNAGEAARGDICRWLTLKGWAPGSGEGGTTKWRMPTSREFGTLGNYTVYNKGTYTAITTTSADGKYVIPSGRPYITRGSTTFPAAGNRGGSSSLNHVGTYGFHWSGSPSDSTYGFNLYFNSGGTVGPSGYHTYRANANPVRCVQEE